MNEMVERLAKIMAERYDGMVKPSDLHRAMVRELIAAMREPTEGMLEAASGSIARYSWPAMIDVALGDSQ